MADSTAPRHLRVRTVDLGLACCAVEAAAAQALADAVAEMSADGGNAVASMTAGPASPGSNPDALEVLVVAGTVTDAMAPLVRAEYDDLRARLGARLRVLSFGSCANTGGPYWDSYAVTKGIDQLLPVDAHVAGCPPRPEALRAALLGLR